MATPSGILNPYAKQLGARDPLAVMASTPGSLAALVKGLGSAGLQKSLRPGSWSARLIICHLADTEIAFAFRIRQCLAEDHHVIQPFDQDRWNALLPERDVHTALQAFTIVREGSIALVSSLSPGMLARPVTHPERGEMTIRTVIETIGGHDRHHLEQLETIAANP